MKLLEQLPAGYVDRFPQRGPWIDANASPPDRPTDASLLFSDGRTADGAWTMVGPVWWGWCDERKRFDVLRPIGWRLLAPMHSTDAKRRS